MELRLCSDPDLAPEELQRHILSTYITIRIGIAAIGIVFPFLLWLGGHFYAELPLQHSMSAYYNAVGYEGRSMRNWFVGLLFVEGISLCLYKGFGRSEDWALNIGGLLAVAVALIPERPSASWITAHGFCAVGLFLCIAFVALFCADSTLDLIYDTDIPDPAKTIARLRLLYKLIGSAMIGSMLVAYILNTVMKTGFGTFWVETAGILSFGVYWLAKGWELQKTAADLKTFRAETRKTGGRVMSIAAR
jgi:hypothetical protein